VSLETRDLPVKLTEAEKIQRGEELGRTLDEIERITVGKKAAQHAADTKLKELEVVVNRLGQVLRDGEERRPVEVKELLNFVRGIAETTRMDTWEIVESRPMTAVEMQGQLFDEKPSQTPPPDLFDEGKAKDEEAIQVAEADLREEETVPVNSKPAKRKRTAKAVAV
jgi:hypothetical protein